MGFHSGFKGLINVLYVNKEEFSASSWRSNQGYTKMHGQPTINNFFPFKKSPKTECGLDSRIYGISLRLHLPITYPFGAKTRRFNTTNTKARALDTILSQLHPLRMRASKPTSTFILALRTNAGFIQNWNTERVQVIRF